MFQGVLAGHATLEPRLPDWLQTIYTARSVLSFLQSRGRPFIVLLYFSVTFAQQGSQTCVTSTRRGTSAVGSSCTSRFRYGLRSHHQRPWPIAPGPTEERLTYEELRTIARFGSCVRRSVGRHHRPCQRTARAVKRYTHCRSIFTGRRSPRSKHSRFAETLLQGKE